MSNDIEAKEWIFNEWENEWASDSEGQDFFYKLFKYDYEDICKKIRRNKKKNFCMKFISFLPLGIMFFVYLVRILIYNIYLFYLFKDPEVLLQKSNESFFIYSIISYVIVASLTVVVARWIGVKKYQETWIKSSAYKYVIDMEMYKFIQKIGEYSGDEKKKYFKTNIIKIWNENQDSFLKNMKESKWT